jgi:hypothetical protein
MVSAARWQRTDPRFQILGAVPDAGAHFYKRWSALFEPPPSDRRQTNPKQFRDICFGKQIEHKSSRCGLRHSIGLARNVCSPACATFRATPSVLEPAFRCFQTVEGVEQLHARFPQFLRMLSRGFSRLDGKPNPINRDSRLICHLKLAGRGPKLCVGLDHRHKFLKHFGFHDLRPSQHSSMRSLLFSVSAGAKRDQIRYLKPYKEQHRDEQQKALA